MKRPSLRRSPLGAVAFVTCLSACSVLFNPSNAPPRACPAGVAACPARPNATVACEQAECRYTCTGDFVDADADESNGCERSCPAGSAPLNPAELVATSGLAPGELRWTWPAVAAPVASYRLCTGLAAGSEDACTDVPATACAAGTCTSTSTGLPDFVRVFAKVLSVDDCLRTGSKSTAPTAAASPITMSSTAGWTLDAAPNCGATVTSGGDIIGLEQTNGLCSSQLLAGDDGWSTGTYDLDVRLSSTQAVRGGVALLANVAGHRLLAISADVERAELDRPTQLHRRRTASAADGASATSIRGIKAGEWQHLRVVNLRGVVSLSIGADAASLVEVLRWPDTTPEAATRTGRVGLALVSAGRVDFRSLVVSTAAVLPPRGPTSDTVSFSAAPDAGFGPNLRVRPSGVALLPCPSWPEGPGCDGGCVPPPDAGLCVRVTRTLFTNPQVGFDLPTGIDVRQPWRLSVRFAPTDAGALLPQVISSPQGPLLNTVNWTTNFHALGQDLGFVIPAYTWNTAELSFDPDGGHSGVVVNGVARTPGNDAFPPVNWDAHLGSFAFGAGGGELYLLGAQLSQP